MKKDIIPEVEPTFLRSCSTSALVSVNVRKWMNLFAEGKLTFDMLKEYWFNQIPAKYAEQPMNDVRTAFESLGPSSSLVRELEEFICGGAKDVMNDYWERSLKNVPALCAKPFNNGEPSYSCKECSTDATCVMCADCFQRSAHRFHKYRMATSAGGGFCDCGDSEAWKTDPSCEFHKPPVQDDALKPQLPPDLYERCKFVFSFVVKFSLEVINKNFIADMRTQFSSTEDSTGKYLLVMYNDEVHTFDQVIKILVQVIKCTTRQGLEFASKINKEGRAVIISTDFRSCCKTKCDIERLSSQDGIKLLEVVVLPFSVVAYQSFSLQVLSWVQNILKVCREFRSIIVDILRNEEADPDLLDSILLQTPELWKAARKQWNLLICSGMLLENEYKMSLGIHFVKNFHSIMQNYITDDEDHPFSVARLSVQLFTVPSIAHTLIADHDAFKTIVDFLIIVSLNERNADGKLDFNRSQSLMFERASWELHDARHLLCSPPTVWSQNLRIGFLSGISSFLELLTSVEGMDAVKRQLETHIEFEPEWETSFNLHKKIYPIVEQLYKWCATDRTVLLEVYKSVLMKLNALYSSSIGAGTSISKSFGAYQATCITFNGTVDPVTVHLPLTRFLGGIYLYLGNFDIQYNSDELILTEKPSPMLVIENTVRTRAMISQFRAGMWRKNGQSLASQLYFYHSTEFREMMLDMDVTVLQIGASLIDGNTFMINLFHKYGIVEWNEGGLISSLPETDPSHLRILADEFLYLMIVLTSERFQVGVGNVTQYECTKYEMTHLLAGKHMLHSELMKAMSSRSKVRTEVEDVLKDIAVFKTEDGFSAHGYYELKEGYPCLYNPYCFHFSKENAFKSAQALKARHKKSYDLECCPSPVLPAFCSSFSKVCDLLTCDVMLRVMKIVLSTFISYGEDSGIEGQLDKVLFLIGLALREEERPDGQFRFTACANAWDIDKLMVNIYCSLHCKDQKDMLKWLLAKYQNIINDWSIDEVIKQHESLKRVNEEQQMKSILAQRARANIMAQMRSMQEKFSNINADAFASSQGVGVEPETTVMAVKEYREFCSKENRVSVTCMLCQEDEVIAVDGLPVVLAAYVQLSTVLMRDKKIGTSAKEEADRIYLSSNMGPSAYVSTCGHAMHAECFVSWRVQSNRRSNNSGPALPPSLDSSKDEYLCPLCGCISNAVLLYSPATDSSNDTVYDQDSNVSFEQWMKIASTVLYVTKRSQHKENHEIASQESCSNEIPSTALTGHPQDMKAFTFRLVESDSSCSEESTVGGNSLLFEQRSDTQDVTGYKVSSGEGWVLNAKGYTEESFGNELLFNCNRLPREGMYWVNDLSNRMYATSVGRKHCEATDWSPTHLWKTVAYTIHTVENNLRYSGRPLLGAFTTREKECLGNIVRMAFSVGECNQARLLINKQCLTCLSYAIEYEAGQPCVLDWDCFGMLLLLMVSIPTIVHVNNSFNIISSMSKFLQRLLLIAQVAQCLITMDVHPFESDKKEKSNSTECLIVLASLVRQNNTVFDTDAVWEDLKEDLRPFLRCCVILQHFYYQNPDLGELDEHGKDTYENLCSYLHLPASCKELLGDEGTQSLFVSWAKHPTISELHKEKAIFRAARIINELVKLPEDYSELLNAVRYFSCPSSNLDDSHNPAMCLVCGDILCSLSYCCQKELFNKKVGACNYHAHHCGGGTCVFLEIRKCQLMMFAGLGRGCLKAPPYLDDHGETDQGLKRGNRLKLCPKSYRKLKLIWLSHGVREEVLRVIERDGLSLYSWQFY